MIWWFTDDESKGFGRKFSWLCRDASPHFSWQTEENHKTLSVRRCLVRYSNPAPPQYKSINVPLHNLLGRDVIRQNCSIRCREVLFDLQPYTDELLYRALLSSPHRAQLVYYLRGNLQLPGHPVTAPGPRSAVTVTLCIYVLSRNPHAQVTTVTGGWLKNVPNLNLKFSHCIKITTRKHTTNVSAIRVHQTMQLLSTDIFTHVQVFNIHFVVEFLTFKTRIQRPWNVCNISEAFVELF
jgi:hypothetical protein